MSSLDEDILERSPGFLRVAFPEVGGGYELTCSSFLVQAVGDCCGVEFCFRAKHGEWEMEAVDERGQPFPVGDSRRFVRGGRYDESKPGALSLEWATRILRSCLSEWWS